MKLLLVRRKMLAAFACVLAAAAMFYVVNHPAVVGASASTRQLPIYCVQRDQKMISISFDAAWGNEDTQELIDILARYNVKATFFVVGDWVDKYPESVKALHDAGHEVMNHSNTHAHMSKLSREEIIADVEACSDKIEAVTGVRPTLIRPPYGEYNDTVISAIRSIGMEPIQWDVDGSQTDSTPCPRAYPRVTKPAPAARRQGLVLYTALFDICGRSAGSQAAPRIWQAGLPSKARQKFPDFRFQGLALILLIPRRTPCPWAGTDSAAAPPQTRRPRHFR